MALTTSSIRLLLTPAEQIPQPINRFRLVCVMGFTQILAWASTYYLPAVLALPIAQDTGWSITSVVGGLSWGLLVAGVSSPLIGRQIDRRGGRPVLAASSLFLASGMLVLALAQNLVIYYAAWTLIGVAMAAGLYDAAFSTLGRLLGEDSRSSITGLTLIGGFASTIGWPLITGLEEWLGWRNTCVAIAVVHLVVALPMHLMLLPGRAARPSGAHVAEHVAEHATSANMHAQAQSYLYLVIAFILTALALVVSAVSVHLLNILRELGLVAAVVLALGMLIGPAQVVARLAEFSIGRNLHPTWSARIGLLLCLVGLALLTAGTPWLAFIAVALYGAGNGILTIVRGTLPLALFGAQGYGARMGRLARPVLVAQACGPVAAATVLEWFGASILLSVMCGVLLLCCAATVWLPAAQHR